MLKRMIKLIRNPRRIIQIIIEMKIGRLLSDKMYVKILYYLVMGKKINIDSPQTFNEKINWLKLYDHNPRYVKMVDKYEAKRYIAELVGEEYVIPTIGVWDRIEDIDFEKLPDNFVLKCTHDSGGVIICKDKKKFDVKKAEKKLKKSLNNNYYWHGREWPYKYVKPRIIAEPYMAGSEEMDELTDYKMMCYAGRVKYSFTCTKRFSKEGLKVTFFDKDWNKLPFERHYPRDNDAIARPVCYGEMVRLAEILSRDMPFARIDFYESEGKPYIGEITLYPGNGLEEFTPEEWDYILGEDIDLSSIIKKTGK